MQDLRGKAVVIDFWSTSCSACVGEVPKMKKLYAEFKEKGLEIIGVNLDAPKEYGGLDKLKEFVKKEGIPWPQYYEGDGWHSSSSRHPGASTFSRSSSWSTRRASSTRSRPAASSKR